MANIVVGLYGIGVPQPVVHQAEVDDCHAVVLSDNPPAPGSGWVIVNGLYVDTNCQTYQNYWDQYITEWPSWDGCD